MGKKVEPGTAECQNGCGTVGKGATRFHDAVDHDRKTGHRSAASLSDGPGDDTGKRVGDALRGIRRSLR